MEWLCKTAAHALVSFCYEDCVEALEKAVELVGSVSEIHEVNMYSRLPVLRTL